MTTLRLRAKATTNDSHLQGTQLISRGGRFLCELAQPPFFKSPTAMIDSRVNISNVRQTTPAALSPLCCPVPPGGFRLCIIPYSKTGHLRIPASLPSLPAGFMRTRASPHQSICTKFPGSQSREISGRDYPRDVLNSGKNGPTRTFLASTPQTAHRSLRPFDGASLAFSARMAQKDLSTWRGRPDIGAKIGISQPSEPRREMPSV